MHSSRPLLPFSYARSRGSSRATWGAQKRALPPTPLLLEVTCSADSICFCAKCPTGVEGQTCLVSHHLLIYMFLLALCAWLPFFPSSCSYCCLIVLNGNLLVSLGLSFPKLDYA